MVRASPARIKPVGSVSSMFRVLPIRSSRRATQSCPASAAGYVSASARNSRMRKRRRSSWRRERRSLSRAGDGTASHWTAPATSCPSPFHAAVAWRSGAKPSRARHTQSPLPEQDQTEPRGDWDAPLRSYGAAHREVKPSVEHRSVKGFRKPAAHDRHQERLCARTPEGTVLHPTVPLARIRKRAVGARRSWTPGRAASAEPCAPRTAGVRPSGCGPPGTSRPARRWRSCRGPRT